MDDERADRVRACVYKLFSVDEVQISQELIFFNASRRDSEDRQTNANGIPQQSAELSDQIPSVKIGSDGDTQDHVL